MFTHARRVFAKEELENLSARLAARKESATQELGIWPVVLALLDA